MNAPVRSSTLTGGQKPDVDVAILGSGFSGLGMGVALLKDGRRDFVILEKADGVGGTWRDNTYPGCACDVSSHLYSFSFEPNPNWSRMFPSQPEIRAYLNHVADKYGLRPHLRFNKKVLEMRFDEAAGFWRIKTDDGEALTARVVASGMGGLSRPVYADIKGAKSFKGKVFHSAEWDHDYDLTGKTVAVIGTGASAIQFVPQIQPKVAKLHLFQRTPPWIMPKPDRAMRGWEKWLFKRAPIFQTFLRGRIYCENEVRALGFNVDPRLIKAAQKIAENHLKKQVPDPALRQKLTPDYTMGCKRVLISNDYYPAVSQPNVELVTGGIDRITAKGVVSSDGVERPVDAIIYGTGFAATDALNPVQVWGVGGRHLNAEWNPHAEAYLGIAVSGYPNLFFLMGPNTGLGHNSMIYMIESQIRFAMEAIHSMDQKGAVWMSPRKAVQATFSASIQHKIAKTVWQQGGCKSWYQTEDGRNTTLWPGFTFSYRAQTRRVDPRDFDYQPALVAV
ncbi:MAG TPA: NAD(P)/FAD-dependent oxidoreductase [Caulobacteraceae bacterium]